jgi:hypothetical protein
MPKPADAEWQLGPEPESVPAQQLEPAPRVQKRDLSGERLQRPLQIVTVEHLAWTIIGLWALVSRLAMLGAAALSPTEAGNALFEYDLANRTRLASAVGFHPIWSGWIHLLQAGIFLTGGSSDFSARLVFALAGLVLVASAFPLRPYLGRAGAIAVGALLVISPTLTYFSRVSATAAVAATMAMLTIATFMAAKARPTVQRAIGLGFAGGLMAAADSAGFITAVIFLVALMLIGLYDALATRLVYFRIRVWLERNATLLVAAIVAAAFGVASELIWFRPKELGAALEGLWRGIGLQQSTRNLAYYAPGILLYEFLLTAAGIAGIATIAVSRTMSRLTLFCLLWLVLSIGFFLINGRRESDWLVQMLVPAALVAAPAIDHLHHSDIWRYARVVLLVLGVATVYEQILTNLVNNGPDASAAPWAQQANLYWRGGATPVQSRDLLRQIRRRFTANGGTVFNAEGWPLALRWYLRDFRPAQAARSADIIVTPALPLISNEDSQFQASYLIDIEESWNPELRSLDVGKALSFLVSASAWTGLHGRSVALTVHLPVDLAPTVILPPSRPHTSGLPPRSFDTH